MRHASQMLGASDAARDVVQETWISVVRGIRGLSDPARFPAWIYSIATRRCADAIRRRTYERRLEARAVADALTEPSSSSSRVDDDLDMRAALARLPSDQQIVVAMFYADDLSVEEISAALGIPIGTVKSRLFNARQALKDLMERETT